MSMIHTLSTLSDAISHNHVYSLAIVAVLEGGEIVQAVLPPATVLEQAAMRGLLLTAANQLEVAPCAK